METADCPLSRQKSFLKTDHLPVSTYRTTLCPRGNGSVMWVLGISSLQAFPAGLWSIVIGLGPAAVLSASEGRAGSLPAKGWTRPLPVAEVTVPA